MLPLIGGAATSVVAWGSDPNGSGVTYVPAGLDDGIAIATSSARSLALKND